MRISITAFLTVLIFLSFLKVYADDDKKQNTGGKALISAGIAEKNSLKEFQDQEHSIVLPGGIFMQTFEDSLFPPPGWISVNAAGSNAWYRSDVKALSGIISAGINFQNGEGEDWLISPQYEIKETDSLSFWIAPALIGYPPDFLTVLISTTSSDPGSFTDTLININVAALPDGGWLKYEFSLDLYNEENIYTAFKHSNNEGCGVFLDDFKIGSPLDYDIAPLSIDLSNPVKLSPVTPAATFTNIGLTAGSFPVTMKISPGDYTSTKYVSDLQASSSVQVSFDEYSFPEAGFHEILIYSDLPGDLSEENDTLRKSIEVYDLLNCGSWFRETDLPTARWAQAAAFYESGTAPEDTGFILVISGADEYYYPTKVVERYNVKTGVWDTAAPLPQSRYHISAVTLRNHVYVPGGYDGESSPTQSLYKYHIRINSWTSEEPLLKPVADYAIGTYGDSLIYIIGGASSAASSNKVQIYNVNNGSWTYGTDKPGPGLMGLRGSIVQNKIVIAGGNNDFESVDDVYIGTIDPLDPTVISWTALKYPAGPAFRPGAGTPIFSSNPQFRGVIFAGGDPYSSGTETINSVWGYDIEKETWLAGPDMPEALNNLNNVVSVERNDTMYMVSIGGYNGYTAVHHNSWFRIDMEQPVSVEYGTPETIRDFALLQNYPNPFNPVTTISYLLPKDGFVTINIYDILGNEIKTLVNEYKPAGRYDLAFNASTGLASGIYIYRLNVISDGGRFTSSKKMILMK